MDSATHLQMAPPTGAEMDVLYRMLWETTTDAVIVLDGESVIRYANPALEEVLGHAPQDVIGQSIRMLQPERLRGAHQHGVETYLRSGRHTIDWRRAEVPGLHRDGHEVPLEIAFSHADIDGRPMLAGFLRNVTARKRSDEALKLSEERLRLAVTAGRLGTWDWDIAADRLEWSPLAREMFGVAPTLSISHQVFLGLLHPEDRAVADAAVRHAIGEHSDFAIEARVVAADGALRWMESFGRVLCGADGRAHRVVGVMLDVTGRKQAEASRRQLEDHLRDAQKMDAIGTLAGGIAHDFNNILAGILGNLALARADLADPQRDPQAAAVSLAQVHKGAMRARQLVQQILAFSRRQPQTLQPQTLQPLLEDVLALLRATLPAGVTLAALLPAAPLRVMADATQIEQVVMNLCTNAWHALGDVGGRIEVSLAEVEVDAALQASVPGLPAGTRIRLSVADNGCGMDAATQARIFEPFFTTKAVGQGTGLGLAVVHGIVAAHGGVTSVHSAPGIGTRVDLYLPIYRGPQTAPPRQDVLPAAEAMPKGQGERVLYIDDDDVMALMVHRLLERCGYDVTTLQDPQAAVALLRDGPQAFDVVVTDLNMPGLSGLEVARQVHALRADLPVIISSGSVHADLGAQALQVGVRQVIEKQNTLELLPRALRVALATPATPV